MMSQPTHGGDHSSTYNFYVRCNGLPTEVLICHLFQNIRSPHIFVFFRFSMHERTALYFTSCGDPDGGGGGGGGGESLPPPP